MTKAMPWTPPNTEDVEALPVGKWWDAVSVSAAVGDRALQVLGEESGAVIQDDLYGKLYWLIETDSARSWCVRRVRVLTTLTDETTLLGVPPAGWTAERHSYWRVPLGPGRYLTEAGRLHEALAQAVTEVLGPVPEVRQLCYRCQLPTDEPTPVAMEHSGGVGGVTIYACPKHVTNYPERLRPHALSAANRRAGGAGRMTASARHLEPECRLAAERPRYAELHGECRGPHEVRLPPRPGQERGDLIMTVRCDCDCHREDAAF